MTIFCLGVIGIYVSKIFIETKDRPYTIVRAEYAHRAVDAIDDARAGHREGGQEVAAVWKPPGGNVV